MTRSRPTSRPGVGSHRDPSRRAHDTGLAGGGSLRDPHSGQIARPIPRACLSQGSGARLAGALPWLLLALVAVASTGCSGIRKQLAFNERFDGMVVGWRNYTWSHQAWNEHESQFCERAHLDHFGEGFRQGFTDIANGENGCVPMLPPRKYWSWQYQTAEGQAKVNAWFAGYPYGARAAEEYGVGNWYAIQTSGMYDTYYGGAAPFGSQASEEVPAGPPVPGASGYGTEVGPSPIQP